jgi:hypothetical protein
VQFLCLSRRHHLQELRQVMDDKGLQELIANLAIEGNQNHQFQTGYQEILLYQGNAQILEALREYAIRADSAPIALRISGSPQRPEAREFERICKLIRLLPVDERPNVERNRVRDARYATWSFSPYGKPNLGIFAPGNDTRHRLPAQAIKPHKCRTGANRAKYESGACTVTRYLPESATPAACAAWYQHYMEVAAREKARIANRLWQDALQRNNGKVF